MDHTSHNIAKMQYQENIITDNKLSSSKLSSGQQSYCPMI